MRRLTFLLHLVKQKDMLVAEGLHPPLICLLQQHGVLVPPHCGQRLSLDMARYLKCGAQFLSRILQRLGLVQASATERWP